MARDSLIGRMIGAATLDVTTYEEVEHATDATSQAALVVVLAAVARGAATPAAVISGTVHALLGWLAFAGLTYFIGTRLFGGTATWGELLRTLGFASAVGILAILAIVPLLGILVLPIVSIWFLVAAVVAIRQALDVSTGQAVMTGLLGWVAYVVVAFLVPGL